MRFKLTQRLTPFIVAAGLALLFNPALALQPPSASEIQEYRNNGTLAERIRGAKSLMKVQPDPALLMQARRAVDPSLSSHLLGGNALLVGSQSMPSTGNVKVLALLIDFPDAPHNNSQDEINRALFGAGNGIYPFEGLSQYYRRSSYGKLNIQGNALGWYRSPTPRYLVEQNYSGRERLIHQALDHYNNAGHDFTQYDNNGDGVIDYLVVIWSGNKGNWATFWWAYQTSYSDTSYRLDGKRLGIYSWQWESYFPTSGFDSKVVIHETGHALGLPDLYDLDQNNGPDGGVGGLDVMDNNKGDHNSYHKWLLGWLSPRVISTASQFDVSLNPVSETENNNMIVVFPNAKADPAKEMFLIENRWQSYNDWNFPNDGLLIWHIDGSQSGGQFKYNNSTSSRKYMRLMEADGLEEIERRGASADAGDFYTPGNVFTPTSRPNSSKYNGKASSVWVTNIRRDVRNHQMRFQLSVSQSQPAPLPGGTSNRPMITPILLLLLDD